MGLRTTPSLQTSVQLKSFQHPTRENRVAGEAALDCRGFIGCMRLHQFGHRRVVALMQDPVFSGPCPQAGGIDSPIHSGHSQSSLA